MLMKDAKGKDIEPGQTLRRIKEVPGNQAGHLYKVIQHDWKTGGDGEDLIADGGYIKQLLWPERAKEFEVVEEES